MDKDKLKNILIGVFGACNEAGLKISINGDAILDASVMIYNTEMTNEIHQQPLVNSNPEKVSDGFPPTDKQIAFAKSLKIDVKPGMTKNELSALIQAKTGK